MSRSGNHGHGELTNEEVALVTETARRRFAGMFFRARHPKHRTRKGTRRESCGTIFGPTRDKEWLIKYAQRNISKQGPLANQAAANAAIRMVVTEVIMSGVVQYSNGAWTMDEEYMSDFQLQSQQLSEQARARKRKQKTNGGYAPPIRRMRRGMPVTA